MKANVRVIFVKKRFVANALEEIHAFSVLIVVRMPPQNVLENLYAVFVQKTSHVFIFLVAGLSNSLHLVEAPTSVRL